MKYVIKTTDDERLTSDVGRTLLIGIGNASRGDDGLGWAFLERIDDERFEKVYRYQLQVEDAELITKYDRVIFVDASHVDYKKGVILKKVEGSDDFSYTTHKLSPEAVVFLCNDLYDHDPDAWTLGITGYQWELGSGLSPKAEDSLEIALMLLNIEFAIAYEKDTGVLYDR